MNSAKLVKTTNDLPLTGALVAAVALCAVAAAGCGQKGGQRGPSNTDLEQCRVKNDKLRSEIVSLKRRLAQSMAHPGTIEVDPEVLAMEGEPNLPKPQEGTLSEEQVVSTMSRKKPVLKACYERAMKKNVSLQRRKITLTIGFRVMPSGKPRGISVKPNYDETMIDCMVKAIRRWRFPRFSGQPVGVETPLTLSPKG